MFWRALPVILHAWATSDVWVAWMRLWPQLSILITRGRWAFRCGMSVIACNPHVFVSEASVIIYHLLGLTW